MNACSKYFAFIRSNGWEANSIGVLITAGNFVTEKKFVGLISMTIYCLFYLATYFNGNGLTAAASILVPLGVEWVNGQWILKEHPNLPVSSGFSYFFIQNNTIWHSIGDACNETRRFWGGVSVSVGTSTVINSSTTRIICNISMPGPWFGTREAIVERQRSANCPAGWYITPAGCVQTPPPITRPLTEEQFVPLVAPQIQPAQVPNILPNTVPIPVETPTINPAPRTVPVPYTPPIPRPLIVPLSDPVMIPNTEPQQWRQPLVQINPSPTPDNPWRVSLNPKERITTSPHGITEPVSDLDPATPAQPSPTSDFCLRNPEVLACARVPEFDIPNDEIQTLTEVISYEPEQFLGGGSCPRPVTVNLGGHTITAFDTPLYCQFISSYFRPVLLAIAAFTSMMIVAGGFRSV